jgi:hypothetical protein
MNMGVLLPVSHFLYTDATTQTISGRLHVSHGRPNLRMPQLYGSTNVVTRSGLSPTGMVATTFIVFTSMADTELSARLEM